MKIITNYIKMIVVLLAMTGGAMKAQNCAANFIWSNSPNGVVTFTSTSNATTSLTTYYWSFGNATSYSATGNNGASAMTTYTANGTYVVTLFLYSSVPTCSSGVQYTITVNNASGCNLTANFNYSQGTNGLVNFNNTTSGANTGTTYLWNFGDNSATNNSTAPAHTFSANGAYTVTLIATNSSTCISTKTLVVNVNSYCNAVAAFTHTYGSNGQVGFTSTSTGTTSNYICSWAFGDGGTLNGPTQASHIYVNGFYTATLTVKNSSINPTCQSTYTDSISVTNNTCNIVSNFTQTVGGSGVVTFSSTSTGTNSNTTYTWNFGNGFTSNSPNPTVTYPSGGIYYVSLVSSNGSNCNSSSGHTINVNTTPCVANSNFTLVPTNTPQYWTAIPSYPWNVTNAQWSWGDGTSTTFSLYASHQYSAAGQYTICLTVTVNCGATASTCTSYSVYKSSQSQSIIYINSKAPDLVNIDGQIATGIATSNNNEMVLNLFPNPSTGAFSLNGSGLSGGTSVITVYNLLGDKMYEGITETVNGSFTKNINIEHAATGVYFVNVKSEDRNFTRKIVINK